MKYKFLIFLLILASNCFATNSQLNFVRMNEKLALDTLDEYGYDVEADTVANYLNKPIQHLMKFQNDTIQLSISIPKSFAGYYKWVYNIKILYKKCRSYFQRITRCYTFTCYNDSEQRGHC